MTAKLEKCAEILGVKVDSLESFPDVGWGGLANAFDPDNKSWATEYGQLKEIMTDKEYAEARSSVLDSFFTAPAVIDGIYEALEKFGFEGGNILEPSCGVGNFIGRMPSEMAENSNVYGVEVDTITGRIAQQLYPNADIQVTGFENTRFQNGAFDVAVGNVPFGELGFQDKEYGTTKLHDFFFAKTMDKVKDGGVVAFITSAGTLDKRDESTRQMLADKADLIGAIRLPGGKNGAFKDNAGTEVTTDIIFLQKHEGKSVAEMSDIPDWVHIGETADGLPINKYFENNPDMVLGEVVDGNKLYGTGTMVVADDNFDLKSALSKAVSKLSAEISKEKPREVYQLNDKETAISADGLRPFSYFKDDKGDIFFKGGEDKLGRFDVKKVMDSKNKDYKRLSAFIDIGFVAGVPLFFMTRNIIGLSGGIILMGCCAAPALICGLYQRNGMYFEQVIKNMFRFFKKPKKRVYRTTNLYECIERQLEYDKLRRLLRKIDGGKR